MSEIKVNSVVNSTGDNDSGLDLATNDKVAIKIANAEVATVDTTGVVFNDASADRDFRVESNGNANMLFVDGGNDRVGIATSSPSSTFNVEGTSGTRTISSTTVNINTRIRPNSEGGIEVGSTSSNIYLHNMIDGGATIFSTRHGSADHERMKITSTGTLESIPTYNNTTGSGANVHISSAGGLLFRSTSSLKYKNTVNDATHGLTELLTLRPVTYKGNNDGDIVFGGLIAEEVHDSGLTEFVQYNDDNEPDALAYGNMVSLCIKAIQELKTELDEAKARITALENGE